ncbi:hypothetical protein A2634_03540 [Candidatus Amesbacteria bacterium RIFCSPHIGHO2_01_FULL_48_32]|uniref:Uncharacterized protein n=1 Tax=Candidatus Amesbacteria bacterium RIFCSPLOWO2_01_FULL_48_25 TaxID=1797259 RepID=A0A1F4ZFC4_9BACT|nr:MAG: hypothetical protein A2634_03540 [Candidatus Amesbacteria bacterium RIFCSPHIGHO2_01_FULL_48_32]OGD04327.1 MAG: hypothetical protein A2989_04805 [Candidatus Amesbacteria bacterium RIFCSPLOWO2_01_FULL_48_25]HJZ04701.1 hypothetical protein [Patescibacteria group bacterium]
METDAQFDERMRREEMLGSFDADVLSGVSYSVKLARLKELKDKSGDYYELDPGVTEGVSEANIDRRLVNANILVAEKARRELVRILASQPKLMHNHSGRA